MHQIILFSERFSEIHDLEKNDELSLFDRVKTTNQTNETCKAIQETLNRNQKKTMKCHWKSSNHWRKLDSIKINFEYQMLTN